MRLLGWALLSVACSAVDAEERFQAMLADGTRLEGRELADLDRPDRPPKLDGKPLGENENPLVVLRDVYGRVRRSGSWLELTNGDILPCEILGWGGANAASSRPAFWLVSPWRTPLPRDVEPTNLRVRGDMVRRAVLHGDGRSTYAPGTLVFRDGRSVTTRGLRFSGDRVTALSESGVLNPILQELAEIHVPHQPGQSTAGVIDDAVFAHALGDSQLARIRTSSGAELTFPRSMTAEDEERRKDLPAIKLIAVRPLWALDTLYVDVSEIVSREYRRADEAPLSLLEAVAVREQPGVQHLAWRRNESVAGSPLSGGDVIAELGLGTHSHSELTFALPPQAKSLRTWVALDRVVGSGGCARMKVFRDSASGKPLWESGFLRGSQPAERVGPLDVAGADSLVLVTEMAHEGRPEGADPLDVRDQVDWLRPMVEIDVDKLFPSRWRLSNWLPELDGWEVAESDRERIEFRPSWDDDEHRWSVALALRDKRELLLERRTTIGAASAFLKVGAAVDGQGKGEYVVSVRADGEKVGTTMNGPVVTDRRRGDYNTRVWLLGDYAGREVTLGLVITPSDGKHDRPHGLMFNSAEPGPLVSNLPADGRPIVPDVLLDGLEPTAVRIGHSRDDRYQPGKLSDGRPLAIRDYPFSHGFGTPGESEITFPLTSEYKRFVAVIGLCPQSIDVGPFEILFDGEPHWTSGAERFGRNSPAAQIDVPIPPGHKSITLRTLGREGYGAWAQAGFMRRP